MSAVNFSAQGIRWRAVPVTPDRVTDHFPALPGTGLLFTSADGEMRFLALDVAALPTLGLLQAKSNAELGSLVQSATPLN